jgi:hypothetical protein
MRVEPHDAAAIETLEAASTEYNPGASALAPKKIGEPGLATGE